MFEGAEALFASRGLSHYEVSNYAAPGEESVHNLHYWRGGSYLGLGAAAVSCLDHGTGSARRHRNEPEGATYLEATAETREESAETLDADALVREALMLGLRTFEGVDLAAVATRAGKDPLFGRERALERRLGQGDVVREGNRLRVPRDRWLHLDGIVADLF
jgi:oxygen-independent coproporphyrinogen-3 oxidase